MGYTKLFEELVRSSVWRADDKTRIVWITLLALKDRHHFVRGSDAWLAATANMSLEDFRKAIDVLSSPDPESHSRVDEGRRIRHEPGGYFIINGDYYAKKLDHAERAAYNAQKQREYRSRKKAPVKPRAHGTKAEVNYCKAIGEGRQEEADGYLRETANGATPVTP